MFDNDGIGGIDGTGNIRENDYITLGFDYNLTFQPNDLTKQSTLQSIMPNVLQNIRDNLTEILKLPVVGRYVRCAKWIRSFHRFRRNSSFGGGIGTIFSRMHAVRPIFQPYNLRNWPLKYKYGSAVFCVRDTKSGT